MAWQFDVIVWNSIAVVVYDYKTWLESHLSTDLKFFNAQHYYKITRKSGKACMQYKLFSSSTVDYLPVLPPTVRLPIYATENESVNFPYDDGNLNWNQMYTPWITALDLLGSFSFTACLYITGGSNSWLSLHGFNGLSTVDKHEVKRYQRCGVVLLCFVCTR